MKIEAQLNGQPVLRSIAKLMMNSMYGRFGMHLEEGITEIVTLETLEIIKSQYTVLTCFEITEALYLVTYEAEPIVGVEVQRQGSHKVPKVRPAQTNVPIAAQRSCSDGLQSNENQFI